MELKDKKINSTYIWEWRLRERGEGLLEVLPKENYEGEQVSGEQLKKT